jgi:hypothetical protein
MSDLLPRILSMIGYVGQENRSYRVNLSFVVHCNIAPKVGT